MGAWGSGCFENDEALDFAGGLTAESGWAPVAAALDAVGEPGEDTDAGASSAALAAAELVAASRGHAPADLPSGAKPFLESVEAPSADLVAQASEAVSRVLMEPSELVELWAESDDAEAWNRAVTDLIDRLSKPARPRLRSDVGKNSLTAFDCAICRDRIAEQDLVALAVRRPLESNAFDREIYVHAACLNAKLHPGRIIQWWRPEAE